MVYVFLAEGFEESEAIVPIDMLRRAGFEVKTCAVGKCEKCGKVVTSSHNVPVVADIFAEEVDMDKAELIFLPGGMPGTKNLAASPVVVDCINKAVEKNILIAAICAAPSVLGELELLEGKNAVCYPGFEGMLKGAKVGEMPAVKDGNIITGRGAGAVLEFSRELITALSDKATAEKICDSIVWKR